MVKSLLKNNCLQRRANEQARGKRVVILKKQHHETIILTYDLTQQQMELLKSTLQSLKHTGESVCIHNLDNIFNENYAIAFLNFEAQAAEAAGLFFHRIAEKNQGACNTCLDQTRRSVTYVFNSTIMGDKQPYVFVNKEIFSNPEQLRLILLQAIKQGKPSKPTEPYSAKLERLLELYHELTFYGCVKNQREQRRRSFYQEMNVIKKIIPDVQYDRNRGEYITQYKWPNCPDTAESSKTLEMLKLPARTKRILLICIRLLTEWEISKETVDALSVPNISLRMLQRDMQVIDAFLARIVYDIEQKKYVLACTLKQDASYRLFRERKWW